MPNALQISGKRYNLLTAIESTSQRSANCHVVWRFRCDCGKTVFAPATSVSRGIWKSCGCHRKATTKLLKQTHGRSQSNLYRVWSAMLGRCRNPLNAAYKNYGGRGIKVCSRWESSFENFLSDMGECPKGLTLDREDNDGNYSPNNCRWATRKMQRQNQRPRNQWKQTTL